MRTIFYPTTYKNLVSGDPTEGVRFFCVDQKMVMPRAERAHTRSAVGVMSTAITDRAYRTDAGW